MVHHDHGASAPGLAAPQQLAPDVEAPRSGGNAEGRREDQESGQRNFDIGGDETEALKRLQALATPRGLLVYQLRPSDAVPAFLVARTVASREFNDLAAVCTFLGEYGGRRYG